MLEQLHLDGSCCAAQQVGVIHACEVLPTIHYVYRNSRSLDLMLAPNLFAVLGDKTTKGVDEFLVTCELSAKSGNHFVSVDLNQDVRVAKVIDDDVAHAAQHLTGRAAAVTVKAVRAVRLPDSEKKQAPLVQAHAFDHYLHGQCGGQFPIDDAKQNMRCPTCLRWLPRGEFSLDHAPQQAGQSRLGPPWLLVSTCITCNSGVAGSTFESAAAGVERADKAAERAPACQVHGTVHGDRAFDAGWMSSHEPVTVADLKSAYLIAFAVLGYSWATSRRLDPVRAGFTTGRPPEPAAALETCGLVTDPSAGRTVRELTAPVPIVLVVAPASEFVIALPLPGTRDVEAACRSVQGRTVTYLEHPWPLMVRETERALGATGFRKPEDSWDAGLTFHLDRCDKPHATTVNPNRATTRAVNRQVRGT